MLPYFTQHFANPSSQHRGGWLAQRGIEQARQHLADLIKASSPKEILFTSGASEANTLAIVGYIRALRKQDPHRPLHAITSQVEHKSVLETFEQLRELQVDVEFLPTNSYGQVEIECIKKHLRPQTVLMSFMWANNEIGSINSIESIARLARENNICFHSDATQAGGKIPIDLQTIPVDFLSLSAHKMYGPKGVGALFRRMDRHHSRYDLIPLIRGGGQEFNLRAGTLNTPGIVGFGEAAKIAQQEFLSKDLDRIQTLTQKLLLDLQRVFPDVQLNGHPTARLPGHLHLSFPGVRWDQWLPRMSELCVSTTSACNSDSGQGSHVLRALGFNDSQIHSCIRLSLGKFTTTEELDRAQGLFNLLRENQ